MVVVVLRSSWQSKEIMSSIHWVVDPSKFNFKHKTHLLFDFFMNGRATYTT